MDKKNRLALIKIAAQKIKNDSSHDILHALRVLNLCEEITTKEGGDLDILIPAALFHDIIVYPKDSEQSKFSSLESAELAKKILDDFSWYPKEKIKFVYHAIKNCSFSKKTTPVYLEEKILQDADRIEATGVISVMRTFASVGAMNRTFYNVLDPFCSARTPTGVGSGLDLFYDRLLIVKDMMHTKTGTEIATARTQILYKIIECLREEIPCMEEDILRILINKDIIK